MHEPSNGERRLGEMPPGNARHARGIRLLRRQAGGRVNEVTAVSLFSGAGGFCEGARLAGWKIACAVEADVHACKTYAANFPGVPLYRGDITRFLAMERQACRVQSAWRDGRIDIVYGGPPCQGYSQIGPRNPEDPRNRLYEEFVRVVGILKPRAFVMENVPNMMAMDGGRFKKRIFEAFRRAGYAAADVAAVASEFGVPQRRRRIFIFGLRGRGDGEQLAGPARALMEDLKAGRLVDSEGGDRGPPERCVGRRRPAPLSSEGRGANASVPGVRAARLRAPALSAAEKRGRAPGVEALHNHHTKGMRARRRKIVAALEPGARGRRPARQPVERQAGTQVRVGSIRTSRPTRSWRICTAIFRNGSTRNMIGGSRCGRQRGCNPSTMASSSTKRIAAAQASRECGAPANGMGRHKGRDEAAGVRVTSKREMRSGQ